MVMSGSMIMEAAPDFSNTLRYSSALILSDIK